MRACPPSCAIEGTQQHSQKHSEALRSTPKQLSKGRRGEHAHLAVLDEVHGLCGLALSDDKVALDVDDLLEGARESAGQPGLGAVDDVQGGQDGLALVLRHLLEQRAGELGEDALRDWKRSGGGRGEISRRFGGIDWVRLGLDESRVGEDPEDALLRESERQGRPREGRACLLVKGALRRIEKAVEGA